VAGVGALLLAALTTGGARAQTVFDTFTNTFQIHGYLENQTIERSDTYVRDWHNASLRNRIDIQLSGTLVRSLDMPAMPGASVEYFLEVRPGYEAAYDVDRDRFGNASTGFSGGAPGTSPFSPVQGLALGAQYLQTINAIFGSSYNPKQFMEQGPKDYTIPMPVGPKISYLNRPIYGACKNCYNTTMPLSWLRFEIDNNNEHYYPLREAYFDIRWFWHGQNWLRLGKQQVVWGKADFFRLQDTVNNVDFAQHFNVEPFEDTRIPNWAASLQHRFGDIGPARDVALTGVWNFDYFTPVGLGQGGQPWAYSFGQAIRSFSFTGDTFEHLFNSPGAGGYGNPTPGSTYFNFIHGLQPGNYAQFGLHSFSVPAYNFSNMGYGAKLDWENETPQIRFALTDFFGEGDPNFRFNEVNMAPGLSTPAQFATLGNCLNAQGVNHLPTGVGDTYFVLHPNSHLGRCARQLGMTNYQLMETFGADGQSTVAFHKANTLGLSFDYFEPESGLVIRAESSWTHNALINDTTSFDWTANNDILQWVIGADSQFFMRLLNPDRTFFGSMQVFAHYDPGAHSIGRIGDTNRLSSYIFTAFIQTHYYRDQVIPLIFAAEDTKGTDGEIGGNVEWLLNDHWSTQVGFTAFVGKANVFDLSYDTAVHPACGAPTFGGRPHPPCTHNEAAYTEQVFGLAQEPIGALRNVYDEIWTRLRYRF
jgi:hypothetical protein